MRARPFVLLHSPRLRLPASLFALLGARAAAVSSFAFSQNTSLHAEMNGIDAA